MPAVALLHYITVVISSDLTRLSVSEIRPFVHL